MVTWEPLEEFLVVECDDVTPCMRKPQQWDTQRQQGHFRTPSFNLNGISFSISANMYSNAILEPGKILGVKPRRTTQQENSWPSFTLLNVSRGW